MVKTFLGAAVIFGGLGLSAQAQSLNTQPYTACTPFTGFPLVLNLGTAPLGVPGESVRCTNTKISAAINALPALIGAGSGSVGSLAATVASFGTTLSGLNTTVTGLNGKLGAANGIATLGSDGLLSLAQRPAGSGTSTPNYTAAPSIMSAPTGNSIPTLSTFNVQATTGSESTREFVASFGVTSNKGATQTDNSGNGDKVAVYAGTVQQPGSGNAWALNTLTERQAGVTKSTLGYELDINNNDQNLGETLGYAGSVARPFLYGMEITGVGTARSTAAMSISGPGDRQIWNRGLVFNNNSTKQASIQDNTVADISLDIRGGHAYPIDMANSGVVNAAIRLPKGNSIVSGNPDSNGARDDSGNVPVIGTDAGGNVQLAYGGSTLAILGSSLLPKTSSNIDLGSANSRLRTAYLDNLRLTPGVAALNTTYASTYNPNVIVMGSGNSVSFCPALSCNAGPTIDHQRTSALFSAVTQDDGHSEEQTVAITTTVGTGTYKIWAPSTAYAVGDNVNFQDSRNAVYRVTQAGTSAASGSGPTGTGTGIVDGSVRWDWINAAAINGKVGLYNEIQIVPGGGNSWAQANNFQLQPGVKPLFHTNLELDFTNNSGTDCAYGVASCYGLYIISNGTNKSTAAIALQGIGQSAQIGMRAAGSYSDSTYSIDTSGVYGIAFQHLTPATYAVAALQDKSTAPVSLNLLGTNSFAAIHMAGAGNVGIDMRDNTYTGAQVLGKGWTVALDGSASVQNLGVNGQSYEFAPFVPPTSNTSCTKGQHSWDVNYEYRCVATNTWKRATLSAW